jgi:hypothetical protein
MLLELAAKSTSVYERQQIVNALPEYTNIFIQKGTPKDRASSPIVRLSSCLMVQNGKSAFQWESEW